MTTEELCAEIERLDAAATAGPWNLNGSHVEWEYMTVAQPLRGTRWSLEGHFEITDEQAAANAALIASYRTLAVEAAKKLREMQADRDFYKNACIQQNFEIQQILGKALGYPTMDTCPEIGGLPTGTDTVFTGIHTAESIADEAATVILRGAQP